MTSRPAGLDPNLHRAAKDAEGNLLVECPFCGSDVGSELVTYGGTCPKCFAEIPGDEAPTDPGAEVRAAQERRDRVRGKVPLAFAFALLLLLVSCSGLSAVGALVYANSFRTAAVLDFDTLDFPMPEIVAASEQVAVAEPEPEGTASAPASSGASSGGGLSAADRARKFAGGGEVPTSSGTPDLTGPASSSGGSSRTVRTGSAEIEGPSTGPVASSGAQRPAGLSDFGVSSPRARRDDNVVLSDPDAIRDMIGERMVESIPGLKICYDRRLKVAPTLKGRWLLKYQVMKDGSVSNASARGLDRADAELERCLAEHIENHWHFAKITLVQPVSKTVTFRP